MTVLYPVGYGTTMVTLTQLKAQHLNRLHPVYAERLFAWIESQGGKVGIGGGFRTTQPAKPGFAPAGKSFHQEQTFASGFKGYCAVDLVVAVPGKVHRAPTWAEVPAQGSAWAKKALVHCNVSTEAWHMQPIEIDGYESWVIDGRPDPAAPPPDPREPTTTPPRDLMEDDMAGLIRCQDDDAVWLSNGVHKTWMRDQKAIDGAVWTLTVAGKDSSIGVVAWEHMPSFGIVAEGQIYPGRDMWGRVIR